MLSSSINCGRMVPSEMMAKAFGMWVTWSTWLNGWQSWFTQLVVLGVPTRYSLQGIVA
jgi:hypothetical protein